MVSNCLWIKCALCEPIDNGCLDLRLFKALFTEDTLDLSCDLHLWKGEVTDLIDCQRFVCLLWNLRFHSNL